MNRRAIPFAILVVAAACSANEPDADVQFSRECLANASHEYSVHLEGTGFENFNGAVVHAVTDIRLAFAEASCRSWSQTQISDGAFTVDLDGMTDEAVYPLVGAFVDLNENGACDAEVDAVWMTYSAISGRDADPTVHAITPADFERQPLQDICDL